MKLYVHAVRFSRRHWRKSHNVQAAGFGNISFEEHIARHMKAAKINLNLWSATFTKRRDPKLLISIRNIVDWLMHFETFQAANTMSQFSCIIRQATVNEIIAVLGVQQHIFLANAHAKEMKILHIHNLRTCSSSLKVN